MQTRVRPMPAPDEHSLLVEAFSAYAALRRTLAADSSNRSRLAHGDGGMLATRFSTS